MNDERADEGMDYETFEAWAAAHTTSEVSEQLFKAFKTWAACSSYSLDWKGQGELFGDTHTDAALDGFLGGYAAAMAVWKTRVEQSAGQN